MMLQDDLIHGLPLTLIQQILLCRFYCVQFIYVCGANIHLLLQFGFTLCIGDLDSSLAIVHLRTDLFVGLTVIVGQGVP